MDAYSKRSLLFYCACFWLGVLGWQEVKAESAYVYEDQYVVEAKGPWCPWRKGIKSCPKVYGEGVYLINARGEIQNSSSDGVQIVQYKAEHQRGCERILESSQGQVTACSPNFFVSIPKDLKENTPAVISNTNDPLIGNLWGLTEKGVNAYEYWRQVGDTGSSGSSVNIAVIDSGVDCNHPDIVCIAEYDATTGMSGTGAARDDNGHGTHCAGTIGAVGDNGLGISGVAKRPRIFAAKFLGANGGGSLYHAVRAIDWAVQQDVDVISASWGAPVGSATLRSAIQRAHSKGVIFVAAAGNATKDIDKTPYYPASYDEPNVVTVGSHTKEGVLSAFSNYGKDTVEVVAPGSLIYSTMPGNQYAYLSGTSMATPHVSGVLALYLQQIKRVETNKMKAMGQAITRLFQSVKQGFEEYSRYGRVELKNWKQSLCMKQKCNKCFERCINKYEDNTCRCSKLRRCKQECREKTSCKKKCE